MGRQEVLKAMVHFRQFKDQALTSSCSAASYCYKTFSALNAAYDVSLSSHKLGNFVF